MDALFTSEDLPAYHEGMLIVKTRPQGPAINAIAAAADLEAVSDAISISNSGGLSALSYLDRAGVIRQVTPLSPNAPKGMAPLGAGGAAMTLASTALAGGDASAGTSIVQLEHDRDVHSLQRALASDPNVEFATRVPARYLLATGNGIGVEAVPPAPTRMWNLLKIEWAAARALAQFKEADGIRVGVLDTGIDRDHPDLQGRVSQYTYNYPDLPGSSSDQDIVGHGTHVSGTIAAGINNDLGINGICKPALLVWKIFNDSPTYIPARNQFAYFVDPVMYRRALNACVGRVDVLNLSIGGPQGPDAEEQNLYNTLLQNGAVIVAAMGNERQFGSPISYPAAISGVVAVGATSLNDAVTGFSNAGNHISLCAPGAAIWSTLPTYPGQIGFQAVPGPGPSGASRGRPLGRETDYDAWNGTSMATPHATAAVALLLAKDAMNPADVRTKLMGTADQVMGMRGATWHPDYGAGRLNLRRLLSE